MNLRGNFMRSNFRTVAATALLAAVGMTPAFAQQSVVSDWSNHHVKFTNPGSETDALLNGHRQQYQSFVNDVRYRAQQFKHSAAFTNRVTPSLSAFSESRDNRESNLRSFGNNSKNSLQGLWTSGLSSTPTAGVGTAQDMFPAEYDASATPNCTGDFLVFPVNAAGEASTTLFGVTTPGQPNLVVFDNLYSGTCKTGTVPNVQAAYYVHIGGGATAKVQTSPTLSEDGTQVAFVATTSSGTSYFYVLTLGTTGTVVSPTELTNTANAHGLTYKVLEFDNDHSDTISSPYIDYSNNIAYVGDSDGYLHQFTGVFGSSTLAETETSDWPVRPSGGDVTLTSPVVDPQTGDIFVGASNGNVYCLTSTGTACTDASFSVTGQTAGTTDGVTTALGAVSDSPIVVDNGSTSGTTGWVFAQAAYTTTRNPEGRERTSTNNAELAQAPITTAGAGTPTRLGVGTVSVTATGTTETATINLNSPALYDGDFDNTYYNSTAGNYGGGGLYFCGTGFATVTGLTGNTVTYDTTPGLYRVGFNADGSINTNSETGVYPPAANTTAEASGCSPLTEFYNANANSGAGVDYLFLSVSGYGAPNGSGGTPNCNGHGCVLSFELPVGSAPSAPTAAYDLGGNGEGTSGIVFDDQSTAPGASQIYFSNLQTGNATQASQAGLE